MKNFVHKKLYQDAENFQPDKDLVVLAGDFNQNAAPMNRLQKEYYDMIKAEERYRPIL